MLRKCKLEVVVAESVHCYNEITKSKEDFIMKLSDKIVRLRKSNGMSQEELADKLGVSRQAISRWEMGTAMPDATNILQLSRLFQVTTDYLLNDEYQSDNDLPKVKEVKTDGIHQIMIFLITLEVMVLIIQFMSVMILQNIFFGVLSFIPFIAMVGGFEYAYQKKANEQNERTVQFRKRFYKVSAWLGAYFPIRLLAMALVHFYPRPINSLALECVIAVLYLMPLSGTSRRKSLSCLIGLPKQKRSSPSRRHPTLFLCWTPITPSAEPGRIPRKVKSAI